MLSFLVAKLLYNSLCLSVSNTISSDAIEDRRLQFLVTIPCINEHQVHNSLCPSICLWCIKRYYKYFLLLFQKDILISYIYQLLLIIHFACLSFSESLVLRYLWMLSSLFLVWCIYNKIETDEYYYLQEQLSIF